MTVITKSRPATVTSAIATAWSRLGRSSQGDGLDVETSVSLRCHLFEEFANSKSWTELIAGLGKKGFYLMFDHDRLVLVNEDSGSGLCTCKFLGFSFEALTESLGKPCVIGGIGRLIARPLQA